ncbi:Rfa2p [Sugiyamaella lignohabitans]|uniref:Rfa2p n=1 Tax=Sugiyamaella lignohabitans TaxID=796027 RepID=A0A167EQW2_9ASCO|nr:Rfa2p [Sugiyamaella lignohabitans]ANB14362.1 Rfa2p [Sugiyamaella lignohabitans]
MNSHSQPLEGGFLTGQGNSSSGFRREQTQSIRPVTIKQLNESSESGSDSEIILDGVALEKVKIVARVMSKNETATVTNYQVEDSTGTYEVKKWNNKVSSSLSNDIDMDDSNHTADDEKEDNYYVSIIGTVKVFNNSRSINATHIRPVTDFNEVIFHQLEALSTHLALSQTKTENGGGSQSLFVDDGGHKTIRDRIIDAFSGDFSLELSSKQLMSYLPGVGEYEIRVAAESLVNQGGLATADDDVYMLAAN